MTEKRFTTVELPSPNRGGIWYYGNYLHTYEVCHLLNEYVDAKKENEQLQSELSEKDIQLDFLKAENNHMSDLVNENKQLKESNERFSKTVAEQIIIIKEYRGENEQLKSLLECSREEANDYCEELMGKDEFVRLYKKENEQLKKAEILANHRGEMISFANSLIDDLGSETMKEMWDKFREKKYEEWRNLE